MRFEELNIGDMFNTTTARYVKTGDDTAIVVMSIYSLIGDRMNFSGSFDVVPLYSAKKESVATLEIFWSDKNGCRNIDRYTNLSELMMKVLEVGLCRVTALNFIDCDKTIHEIPITKVKQ